MDQKNQWNPINKKRLWVKKTQIWSTYRLSNHKNERKRWSWKNTQSLIKLNLEIKYIYFLYKKSKKSTASKKSIYKIIKVSTY